MAAFREVLSHHFPNIDHEISDYVSSLLEDGSEDFSRGVDVYEAIGALLQQTDNNKSDDEIKDICDGLYKVMNGDADHSELVSSTKQMNGMRKVLSAPVVLSSLADDLTSKVHENRSIWEKKKGGSTTVDQKKLAKADAKIQKKQGKRVDIPVKKQEICDQLATASQQINKRDARLDASGNNRSTDIKIEDFDIAFGERVLLQGATIHLVGGRRYGFIGRNGLGKTTLLKLISSRQLKIPSHISILHVEQEVNGDETIALQSVLECDEKRESLLRRERELTALINNTLLSSPDNDNATELHKIFEELEAMEAAKAPARAAQILNGLGFSPKDQTRITREFSGGWRMRLALARALFTRPDLLLLDEPTNMLDMKAIIWLENYLQDWPKTILVVSHDRQFLNAVATDILHLYSMHLETYRGNYEVFHKTREEKLKSKMKEYEAQKQYRDHIQVFIDRFRYNANRASQVQSKLKLLEKLPELTPVEKETEVVLRFPDVEKLNPPILQLDEVTFYFSKEKVLFISVNLNANMESRICIVGENGAGKTTLLKLLLGNLDPIKGHRHAHRNLRIGYFTQHHVDQLDMGQSSVELLASRFPGMTSEVYRGQLGSFGVSGDFSLRPVSSLSGGQKSRVAFSVMSMANPNFFILDEPTNHLDMETIEALGDALNKFKGGVVLVSHDERLIRKICKELWVVSQGMVKSLEGGIDEYKAIVQAELEAAS